MGPAEVVGPTVPWDDGLGDRTQRLIYKALTFFKKLKIIFIMVQYA